MLVPLNITGGSYQSRSTPLSAQRTSNFYPEVQDDLIVTDKYVLQPFPGCKIFGSSGGLDRGMIEHQGVLYKVSGITFYSINSSGAHTAYAVPVVGSLPVVMTGMGDNVLICTGEGIGYQYNLATVTEITDINLTAPTWVAHLNNHAIYDGGGQIFWVSDSGDATTINGLNFASAESNADNTVRGYVFNQRLYLFGEKTTEPWWNSGVGNPPFDRVEGGIIRVGLAARMAVSSNDTFMYWLGDDRRVYRSPGSGFEAVSNIALSSVFESYSTVSDAVGFCFTLQGQNFYHLSFPSEDNTWVYSEPVGQWFELSRSGSDGRGLSNSHAYAYGKNYVSDYRNSNVYEWDVDTFDENGLPMIRQRDTGVLNGALLGFPGRELELNRFELILERGIGLISGQGSDPAVMLQISFDGGRTFGNEQWAKVGKSADFQQKVEWFGLGRGSDIIFRVKTSDPVRFCIHAANADIEIGA